MKKHKPVYQRLSSPLLLWEWPTWVFRRPQESCRNQGVWSRGRIVGAEEQSLCFGEEVAGAELQTA